MESSIDTPREPTPRLFSNEPVAADGDMVQLVGLNHKNFILRLKAGDQFQSHRGVIKHDDMIGTRWGSQIFSHMGSPFYLIQPSLADLLRNIKRNTQILYPKEIGHILITMGIGPGMRVIEAGTGSGSMTTALAYMVGKEGRVYTYEAREPMQNMARGNLKKIGLDDRVDFKLRNISEGFDETGIDALFLDLPNPYDYVTQVRGALKVGGFFCTLLPTTNQVIKTLRALKQNYFAFIDVCEVLLRYYKSDPERFRPTDRMVAHTGYLIFARPILAEEGLVAPDLLKEIGAAPDEPLILDEADAEVGEDGDLDA